MFNASYALAKKLACHQDDLDSTVMIDKVVLTICLTSEILKTSTPLQFISYSKTHRKLVNYCLHILKKSYCSAQVRQEEALSL